MIFLCILMVVGMTAIASTVALTGGVGTQVTSLTYRRDQAFYAAEAGVQRALYEVQYGTWISPAWVDGQPVYPTLTAVVGPCSYTVTGNGGGFNSPIRVTSTGTHSDNSQINSVITVILQPRSTIPAIQLGSSISEAGNITVDGNALIKGNIFLKGKVAIHGFVEYGGTENNLPYATFNPNIPDPPRVWYDETSSLTPPDNIINVNELIGSAEARRFVDVSPAVLDFTSDRVLYIRVPTGHVLTLKSIGVYGSGTLVVIGDVEIQNGVGGATESVNIVATGNVHTKGNFRIFGSVYAGGDLTHQGQFQVTGIISAQGNMNATESNMGAGGATIVRAPPPPFDPRGGTGSGSVLIQNFTGPTLE